MRPRDLARPGGVPTNSHEGYVERAGEARPLLSLIGLPT